jgi:microsomal epoxide hydrolase
MTVNMLTLNAGETIPPADSLTPEELELLERSAAWQKTGLAYALEHWTRPATIGLVVSSNPLALLAW